MAFTKFVLRSFSFIRNRRYQRISQLPTNDRCNWMNAQYFPTLIGLNHPKCSYKTYFQQ